jgi:hypothetical protein
VTLGCCIGFPEAVGATIFTGGSLRSLEGSSLFIKYLDILYGKRRSIHLYYCPMMCVSNIHATILDGDHR